MATYTKYSSSAFIALVAPIVMQVHKEGGRLLPSVRIAQSWHETGGSMPSWHNLGGYKVGSGKVTPWWDGSSVNTATKEVYGGVTVSTTANWRAYKSIYHYYKDQDLLFGLSRYARVRAAKSPEEQCRMLQACGYATDPKYADKLLATIKAYGLAKYDAPAVAEPKKEDKPLDKAKVIVDGKPIADGVIIDGSVYVPIRAVSEAIDAKIGWDNQTKTATLTRK